MKKSIESIKCRIIYIKRNISIRTLVYSRRHSVTASCLPCRGITMTKASQVLTTGGGLLLMTSFFKMVNRFSKVSNKTEFSLSLIYTMAAVADTPKKDPQFVMSFCDCHPLNEEGSCMWPASYQRLNKRDKILTWWLCHTRWPRWRDFIDIIKSP